MRNLWVVLIGAAIVGILGVWLWGRLPHFTEYLPDSQMLSEKYLQPIYFGAPQVVVNQSENELIKILNRDKNNVKAITSMAILMVQAGRWQEATRYYQRWVNLNPADVNGWIGYAYALVNLQKPRDAITLLRNARKHLKSSYDIAFTWHVEGDIWWSLALAYPKQKKEYLHLASQAHDRALQRAPQNARFLLGLVRVALASNDLGTASRLIDRIYAIGVSTKREQALSAYYKAVILERSGRIQEAQSYYKEALKADSKSFINIRKIKKL